MILYMLKKMNFPMTNSQLNDFFVSRDYSNYFTLQQVITELTESNLISARTIRNSTRYEITREGEDVLHFFGRQISAEIAADMDSFMAENKFQMRSEVGVTAEYEKAPSGSYIVDCRITEGKTDILQVKVSVPTEGAASAICDRWAAQNQDIYTYIMQKLL